MNEAIKYSLFTTKYATIALLGNKVTMNMNTNLVTTGCLKNRYIATWEKELYIKFTIAAPHVSPPPNAANKILSPFFIFPSLTS